MDVTEQVFDFLHTRHPIVKPRAAIDWAFTEQEFYDKARALGIPRSEAADAAAFYHPDTNQIIVGSDVTLALKDERIGEVFVATRYLSHEHFHGMRLSRDRIRAFEEAGAELFANQAMYDLTGLGGEQWHLREYAPFVAGVRVIASALGEHDALQWLLKSRAVPEQAYWAYDELSRLNLSDEQIFELLELGKPADWLTLVRKLLGV